MSKLNITDYQKIAREIRRDTFEMVLKAGKGHLGGSFSNVELLTALYYGDILRHKPADPSWEERDRFILSKAHANNSLYVLLAKLGYYPAAELSTYLADGSRLGMHNDRRLPGIEVVGGSLGHGLGLGAGIALGARLSRKDYLTVVMMGDGESQEGSVWEAAMFAASHRLANLVGITDRNHLGSEDFTENTMPLEPLADRWRCFGWEVRVVNGHDFEDIFRVFQDVRERNSGQPLMVIAETIKGKGLSVLENSPHAHHTLPKAGEIEKCRQELQ